MSQRATFATPWVADRRCGRSAWLLAGALALGCSSTAESDAPEAYSASAGLGGGGDFDEPGGDDGAGSDGGTGAADSSAPSADGGGSDGGGTGAGTENKAGCPDVMPAGWVFCEDFESIADPIERFFDYADAEGRFALVDGTAASGVRSMQSQYAKGVEGAGQLIVSFGASPIDDGVRPAYDTDVDFDEVYWRFRVRMEQDWPNIGPGRLTRAMSFAAEDWSEAFVAHVASAGAGTTLQATPQTCIDQGTVTCQGYDDTSALEAIGALVGSTELFSAAASGSWHCVEVHMKLNTPGEFDGVLEFWVDDHFEAGIEALNWRGTWDAYGINAIAVENFWSGGAPGPFRRWIDDLVISTEPIGCE